MMTPDQLAHLAYGEIVKRFHLGSAHVFASWSTLSEDDRARWRAVFASVHDTLKKEYGEDPADHKPAPAPPAHPY